MNPAFPLFVGSLAVVTSLSLCEVRAAETIRVGVWNIEKLSTSARRGFPELQGTVSLPPRTPQQLAAMADYIENQLQADALLITEIDPDSPESTAERPQSEQLNEVCRHLGAEWRYFLSRTGGRMRLGVLFNTQKIRLKRIVNLDAQPFPVAGADVYDRDPFIVWIEAVEGGEHAADLLLACVHLKSQQHPYRDNRVAAMAKLAGDLRHKDTRAAIGLPSGTEEPEILVLGDCNDSSFELGGFRFMFDYLEGVGFAHLRPDGEYPHTRVNGSRIDHIFATEAAIGKLIIPGSFQVHLVPENQRAAYRRDFSDHFPVTVDLATSGEPDLLTANPADVARPEVGAAVAEGPRGMVPLGEDDGILDDEGEPRMNTPVEIIEDDFERILAPVVTAPPVVRVMAPLRMGGEVTGMRFEGRVVGEWLISPDEPDRQMMLTEDFSFVDANGVQWTAPKGSIVDGASIPPIFWNKFIGPPFVGDYRLASVIHDVACERQERPHREAHRMFYEGCMVGGVGKSKALVMYWAVRTFGPTWGGGTPAIVAEVRTMTMEGLAECYQILEIVEGNPDIEFDKVEAMLDRALGEE